MKVSITFLVSILCSTILFGQINNYLSTNQTVFENLISENLNDFDQMKIKNSDLNKLTNCKYTITEEMINSVVNKLSKRHLFYLENAKKKLIASNITTIDSINFIGAAKDKICDQLQIIHLFYLVNNTFLVETQYYEINEHLFIADKDLINTIESYNTWLENDAVKFYLDADIVKNIHWKQSFYLKNKDKYPLTSP